VKPEGTFPTEVSASVQLLNSASAPRGSTRRGQGSFRGVGMVYEACRAAPSDAGVGSLCEALRAPRRTAMVSVCRSVGSSLRPPRPSTVTGPGPSRTAPGRRFGMANHPSSALPDRFPAPSRLPPRMHSPSKRPHGSRAPRGGADQSRSSDRAPWALPLLGFRDLTAPPPT
jgi:hypothetical protein